MTRAESFIMVEEEYKAGVCLDSYNGVISVCNARQGDVHEVFMDWCYPQYDRKPKETAVPWGMRLGDKANAIKVLKKLVGLLSDEKIESEKTEEPVTPGDVQNDVPF